MDAAGTLSLRRYGPSPGGHSHDHFQILLGLAGALELEINGRGVRVSIGDGCVIAPGMHHDFEAASGSLCLVVDSADPGWAQCTTPSLRAAAPHAALTLARYLADAIHNDRPLAQTHGAALLREAWMAGTDAVARTPNRKPSRRRPIDWAHLRQWAAQRVDADLSVADLALRVHLSPSQFAARCRDDLGMSAMAWLRSQRLAQARLLRGSGMAVADVAQRTGYRSPSALTAALRREALLKTPGLGD